MLESSAAIENAWSQFAFMFQFVAKINGGPYCGDILQKRDDLSVRYR